MNLPEISVSSDVLEEREISLMENQVTDCIAATMATVDLTCSDGAELSVHITADEKMQSLNHEWRGIEKPTNVLSFPGSDIKPGEPAGRVLGDIVISIDTVRREARLENITDDQHLSHLIIHGFLHLFGYDHETDLDAKLMEGLETKILARMGIPDPHASLDMP